jgi:hypothetical protein
MKNKMPNVAHVWKQLEDSLVPRLGLNVIDRAVYSYLFRHSRLEGKSRLHFSLTWLARGVRLSPGAARPAVRRLIDRGALRLIKRSKAGHHIEVLLPREIRGVLASQTTSRADLFLSGRRSPERSIDAIDFMQNQALRCSIHAREGGRCFYCLRRLASGMQCLDHVVPQVQLGTNSYRNLVSCCLECNSLKSATPATDFLRKLYRDGRLTSAELTTRLRAVQSLTAGELRPLLATQAKPLGQRGRPPIATLHQKNAGMPSAAGSSWLKPRNR